MALGSNLLVASVTVLGHHKNKVVMHDRIDERWFLKTKQEDSDLPSNYSFTYPVGDSMSGWWRPTKKWWLPNSMPFTTSSYYMVLRPDGLHPAIDFWASDDRDIRGHQVQSIGRGVVVDVVYDRETYPDLADEEGRDYEWGNLVLVMYRVNDSDKFIWALYAHLDCINVALGQKVERGEIIGLLGGTDGAVHKHLWDPHLHFEIRKLPLIADAWPRSMGFGLLNRHFLKEEVYHHPLNFIDYMRE